MNLFDNLVRPITPTLLTTLDADVRAVPELFADQPTLGTTVREVHVDPVGLVRCTLAGPRRGVELVVAGVLAPVSSDCCSIVAGSEKGWIVITM